MTTDRRIKRICPFHPRSGNIRFIPESPKSVIINKMCHSRAIGEARLHDIKNIGQAQLVDSESGNPLFISR
ncbi:hypothetical protein QUF72_12350 [Desulfobacterales bacterium HSG2]|nr:hypothetical protein [Desulfobacterales bacterium HSG2]